LSEPSPHGPGATNHSSSLRTLTIAALGIVFGDIGTSPLYAVKECFHGAHAIETTRENVLGVMSLIVLSLVWVVTFKYLTFILRADNKGEGGIFALLALIPRKSVTAAWVPLLALFGAALLYGDGVITPAISVLSAVEGLGVATTALEPLVVPITLVILLVLFYVQRHGTHGIGRIFGPVMVVWFLAIGLLGIRYILKAPEVFAALNPWLAIDFFLRNKMHGVVVLGSVVLCITGGEALYADMGHFGRKPIRLGWLMVVFPALLLNYFGQSALLLRDPAAAVNPFYGLVPTTLLYPMVALSTISAVIASQALISGAFSLTRQAVQLGYSPRVTIVHTSEQNEGQIYIPEVNHLLGVACVGVVLAYRESTGLAAAYGIAVTGTMIITSIVYLVVTTKTWGWKMSKALPLVATFLLFDLSYFGANLLKLLDGPGGWFPVIMGVAIFTLFTTWKRGRSELSVRFTNVSMPLDDFITDILKNKPHRVRGTAVFMSSSPDGAPPVLLHHLKHNQVLHEQVVLLSILSAPDPVVPPSEQIQVDALPGGFFRVIARYGFIQTPNVPDLMRRCAPLGLKADPARASFYLGRETLLTSGKSKMFRWRKALFAFVARNARSATAYFGIPPGRVVELGMQLDL